MWYLAATLARWEDLGTPLTRQKCPPLRNHGAVSLDTVITGARVNLSGQTRILSSGCGTPLGLGLILIPSRRTSPCLFELSVTALRGFLQGTGGSFGSAGRSDLSFFTKQLCESLTSGPVFDGNQQGIGHTSHKQDRLRKARRDHPRRERSRWFRVMCVSAHSDQNRCSEEPLSLMNTSCHLSGAGNDLSLAEKVGVPCNCRPASAPLVWRRAGPMTCGKE